MNNNEPNIQEVEDLSREGEIIHSIFNKPDLEDMISLTKTQISKISCRKSQIVNSITTSSYKNLVGLQQGEFLISKDKTTDNYRFKSKFPHVELKCPIFESLQNGWLMQKIDCRTDNKILINSQTSLGIIDYDIEDLRFSINKEIASSHKIISSACFAPELSQDLVCYSELCCKYIKLYDLNKCRYFDKIKIRPQKDLINITSFNNMLICGSLSGEILIIDIRTNDIISQTSEKADSFNPIYNFECLNQLIIYSQIEGIKLMDLRKSFNNLNKNAQFLISQQEGINVAKFGKMKSEDIIFLSQVGQKYINIFDPKIFRTKKKCISLRRKLVGLSCNTKDQEVVALEGSKEMIIGFHKSPKETYVDEIYPKNDCVSINFNRNMNCLISMGSKVCEIYNFNNEGLWDLLKENIKALTLKEKN